MVRFRTNFKGEDIYLYRLILPPEEVRARLIEYIDRLNELHVRPGWYNAVTANCTTSIRSQRVAAERTPWDWRMLLNGYADKMLYERHALAGDLPFGELKSRALINTRAPARQTMHRISPNVSALVSPVSTHLCKGKRQVLITDIRRIAKA